MDDNGAFQRPPKSEYNGLKKYLGTVGRRPSAVQWRCLTSSLRRCRHDECPEPCEKIPQLQTDYPENQHYVFKWGTVVFYGDHAGCKKYVFDEGKGSKNYTWILENTKNIKLLKVIGFPERTQDDTIVFSIFIGYWHDSSSYNYWLNCFLPIWKCTLLAR